MEGEQREQNFSKSEELINYGVFTKYQSYSTEAINACRFDPETIRSKINEATDQYIASKG